MIRINIPRSLASTIVVSIPFSFKRLVNDCISASVLGIVVVNSTSIDLPSAFFVYLPETSTTNEEGTISTSLIFSSCTTSTNSLYLISLLLL